MSHPPSLLSRSRRIRIHRMTWFVLVVLATTAQPAWPSPLRRSAIVQAVEQARPSVVNIHGHKIVRAESEQYQAGDQTRRVNGMGTGVVIDQRGYILTNHHVVDGVRRIQVTLADGRPLVARLIAHDPITDLAVIKIPVKQSLPTLTVGKSNDIMEGETVIAVGNAYGYEHTVTRGIVSALHRNVQVNDTQEYQDLIQTDASINPGNSGGPLLNIDGEMIGINVAVRVGAQGIGFAIPVDKAMQVAAMLMNAERLGGVWHGAVTEDAPRGDTVAVVVRDVKADSPALAAGLRKGDVITRVNGRTVQRSLDVERALLGTSPGQDVSFAVNRANAAVTVELALASAPMRRETVADRAWGNLGLRLSVVPTEQFQSHSRRFRGGLKVLSVRGDGPAARQGIRQGDILVGMHTWETISMENLAYIMNQSDFGKSDTIQFYIIRDDKTLSGTLPLSWLR